jgi:hypothetical protein
MPERPTHQGGHPAPASATYEQVNLFGTLTGVRIDVACGNPLPGTPIGHGWAMLEEHPED